jgi:hypothetical protein
LFVTDNEFHINVTTGATGGIFNMTLNNGISVTLIGALLITSGTVYEPASADWSSVNLLDVSETGKSKITVFGSSSGVATWNKEFDFTKNWDFRIRFKTSPLGGYIGGNDYNESVFELVKVTAGTVLIYGQMYMNGNQDSSQFKGSTSNHSLVNISTNVTGLIGAGNTSFNNIRQESVTLLLRCISGVLYAYNEGTLLFTFTDTISENLKLKVRNRYYDWQDIKYIEY